jgi:hypothetical protein
MYYCVIERISLYIITVRDVKDIPVGGFVVSAFYGRQKYNFAAGRLRHCKDLATQHATSSVTFLFLAELNANQLNTWDNRQKYPMKEMCRRFQ